MQDRLYPNFNERAGQSEAAKLANLEAFRAALAPNVQDSVESDREPEMLSGVAIISQDRKVSSKHKHLLSFVPKRYRRPILVATASVAALGAAACTSGSGNNTEFPQAPTNQGGVLGEQVTPVPSVSSESGQQNQPEQHKKAPDFTLNDRNGNPVSLSDFGDQPLIIEFAIGGCPPCNYETNKLAEIHKRFAPEKLVVLNISNEDSGNFSPEVRLLLDPSLDVAEEYEVLGPPTTVFIRGGKIIYKYAGFSQENSDLDLLTAAFMAGKDMNSVLPTATPRPTETSTPVITKEKISSDEAVFDLGNFDLGVKEWEEWPNAHPTQLEIGGKVIDVKNVVVKTIFRSKADRVSNLIDSAEELLNSNVYFVDSSGQDIVYYPGSGSVSVKIDEPLKYGGAINEPFVQNLKGDFMDTNLLCSSKKYTLDRFTAGFGIPVLISATVPINVRDYGIAILEPGASKRKIVMKDEAASDFKTIAEDVPVHDPDYVFRLEGNNGEYVDSSFKGFQRAQYSHGFPPDTLAMFHFIDRSRANPFHYPLLQGNLFLKDGRVLQIELAEGSLNFGQEGDLQGNVGGVNPENKCPLVNHTTLSNAYSFDLEDSVVVINFGFVSAAWKVQDGK